MRAQEKYSFLTVTASALESFCWHRYPGQGSTHLSQQKVCRALGAELLNPHGKQHLVVACSISSSSDEASKAQLAAQQENVLYDQKTGS